MKKHSGMATAMMVLVLLMAAGGCGHLSGYDAKVGVGKTDNGQGRPTLYTGGELVFHVKCE